MDGPGGLIDAIVMLVQSLPNPKRGQGRRLLFIGLGLLAAAGLVALVALHVRKRNREAAARPSYNSLSDLADRLNAARARAEEARQRTPAPAAAELEALDFEVKLLQRAFDRERVAVEYDGSLRRPLNAPFRHCFGPKETDALVEKCRTELLEEAARAGGGAPR